MLQRVQLASNVVQPAVIVRREKLVALRLQLVDPVFQIGLRVNNVFAEVGMRLSMPRMPASSSINLLLFFP